MKAELNIEKLFAWEKIARANDLQIVDRPAIISQNDSNVPEVRSRTSNIYIYIYIYINFHEDLVFYQQKSKEIQVNLIELD